MVETMAVVTVVWTADQTVDKMAGLLAEWMGLMTVE